MTRYAIKISYDGRDHSGWQVQPGLMTIQQEINEAISSLGESAVCYGAGRTDTGVSASAMVAHFDLEKRWEPRRLKRALNAKLPECISVMGAAIVDEDFHARFSAVSREYRYFIWNCESVYPMIRDKVYHLPSMRYDWSRAMRAAEIFEGEHDFLSFCRSSDMAEGATTVRKIFSSSIRKKKDLVIYSVKGNGFLTNMIRIIVGVLCGVAEGKLDEDWITDKLERPAGRAAGFQTAPACGLFFWNVEYDRAIEWS